MQVTIQHKQYKSETEQQNLDNHKY